MAGLLLRTVTVEAEVDLRRLVVWVLERFLVGLTLFLPVVFFKDPPSVHLSATERRSGRVGTM